MVTTAKPGTAANAARNNHHGIQRHVPPPTGRGRKMRSAITSGRKLFVDGDSSSAWGRRFADLVVGHVLDAGGKDNISEATFSLIKRASALETTIEALEARLSRGLPVNLDEFGRAASHLRRLFEVIGVERRQKDVTPNYLEAKYELED
jgi:hypothetical protein